VLPKSNTEFWQKKLARNKERDRKDYDVLLNDGWRVGVVWECSITGKNRVLKIRSVSEEISLWLEEGFDEPSRTRNLRDGSICSCFHF
jgi:DNA mismatch endonuclease, patch repair protein